MADCLHKNCYRCKHFKVHINRFENYYVCGCELFRKYLTKINDVTLVMPNLMLNVGIAYL